MNRSAFDYDDYGDYDNNFYDDALAFEDARAVSSDPVNNDTFPPEDEVNEGKADLDPNQNATATTTAPNSSASTAGEPPTTTAEDEDLGVGINLPSVDYLRVIQREGASEENHLEVLQKTEGENMKMDWGLVTTPSSSSSSSSRSSSIWAGHSGDGFYSFQREPDVESFIACSNMEYYSLVLVIN